jgi:hypothetical protein
MAPTTSSAGAFGAGAASGTEGLEVEGFDSAGLVVPGAGGFGAKGLADSPEGAGDLGAKGFAGCVASSCPAGFSAGFCSAVGFGRGANGLVPGWIRAELARGPAMAESDCGAAAADPEITVSRISQMVIGRIEALRYVNGILTAPQSRRSVLQTALQRGGPKQGSFARI